MTVSDDRLAEVAERAARAGGAYLRDTFRSGPVTAEYGPDDVRSEVDREAERRVLGVIRDAFPAHRIYAEESGRTSGRAGEAGQTGGTDGRSDRFQWFVDPLDGTNNFASGLPTFATAVAVRRDGKTRAAAIYEPVPDDLYLARRGRGATVDGDAIAANSDVGLDCGTVSLVVGLPALRDPVLRGEADRMETALRNACKRVLQTWAPCVDWGLLARGGIEGLVAFHPAAYERHAGELLAAESGASAVELNDDNDAEDGNDPNGEGSLYVGASNEELLTTLRGALERA